MYSRMWLGDDHYVGILGNGGYVQKGRGYKETKRFHLQEWNIYYRHSKHVTDDITIMQITYTIQSLP